MMKTHYDTLGVPRDAKLTDITRAYNRLSRVVTRDDAPPDLKAETALREAYEAICDPGRRERYDASLVAPDRRRRSRTRAVLIGAVGSTVAGDPQRRAAVLARTATARDGEREQEEEPTPHFTAFERTAPVAVARTSTPGCGPGQTSTFRLPLIVRLEPTWKTRPLTTAALPLSSNACAR